MVSLRNFILGKKLLCKWITPKLASYYCSVAKDVPFNTVKKEAKKFKRSSNKE